MARKREAPDAVEAVGQILAETTADIADRLRLRLLANNPNKRLRIKKRPTIAIDAINSTPGVSPLFEKLPRELRDKIYGYIWSETPILKQRYKRKWYAVSYGEQEVRAWSPWSKVICADSLCRVDLKRNVC
jgi:hypothetical protein